MSFPVRRQAVHAVVLLLLLLPPSLRAQSGSAGLLPEGQTLLSLSVTERRMVVPDRLVVSLRVEQEDSDPEVLQQRINRLMQRALEALDDQDGITVRTGRYSVHQYQRQPRGGRSDSVWRGSQSVTLETGSAYDRVHELAGELQDTGFVMNRLDWEISDQRSDAIREGLLEVAIERAQRQAQRAGDALARNDVEIAEITVESGGGGGPVMMRSAVTGSAEAAMPASRPGETEVSLTISVRAVAR